MISWTRALRQGAWAGSLASVFSAVALVVAGQRRGHRPFGPVNAISHWVWGDAALRANGPDLRHTALGYLIHQCASLFWSTLHVQAWNSARGRPTPARALEQAAVTAAAACFVDYRMTPHRFTPGFEHRLGRVQMAWVYGCFALGLAAGTLLSMRHEASARHRLRHKPLPPRPHVLQASDAHSMIIGAVMERGKPLNQHLKPGSKVVLAGHRHELTVRVIAGGFAYCEWTDGGELKQGTFDIASLAPAPPAALDDTSPFTR